MIVNSSNASSFNYCFEIQLHTASMRQGDQRPRFPPDHDSDDPGFPDKGRDLHRFRCKSNTDGNAMPPLAWRVRKGISTRVGISTRASSDRTLVVELVSCQTLRSPGAS